MSTLRKLAICAAFVATTTVIVPVSVGVNHGQPHVHHTMRAAVTKLSYPVAIIPRTDLTAWTDSQPLATKPVLHTRVVRLPSTSATTWPDATDPMSQLPRDVQAKFACIRYHESRDHLHSLEPTSGAAGWYQFTPYIWWYATTQLPGLPSSALQATGDQQSRVAAWYYKRNNGFYPEWAADDSVCNL